jgi:GABA permease/S-methylmethionine transporter
MMMFEVMLITEMSIVNPAPGSFRVHASEIFGPWIGFVNGWMFWCSGVLGMASEVVAAAIFTSLWLPKVPLWIFCIVYAAIMTAINLKDARGLSKIESFLASIKVIALIMFIILGSLIVLRVILPGSFKISPAFQSVNSFMPNGFHGILASMIMVMFSYVGTGIIGLSIADAEDPGKDAPPAVRVITLTVLVLYSASIFFIVLLTPWNTVSTAESPFVSIISRMGIPFGAAILNFIVLTAALSSLNSSMYSASRMLSSLSSDRQAPKIILIKNKNGVPVYALGFCSAVLAMTAILSYLLPQKIFIVLSCSSGFTAMFNWITISITHLFYRKKTLRERPERLKYKVPGYPLTSIAFLMLIVSIFFTSYLYRGQISGLIGRVVLLFLLIAVYLIFISKKRLPGK